MVSLLCYVLNPSCLPQRKRKKKIREYHKPAWGGAEGDHDDVEIRPVRRQDAIESGLDYWIDERDYEKEKQRLKNRKLMEAGAVPKEKLIEEVVAPYKQNWIGVISVSIVALSAIGTAFPELLQMPVIPIPDL